MFYIRQMLTAILAMSVMLHVITIVSHLKELKMWRDQCIISNTLHRSRRIALRTITQQIWLHFAGIVLETLVIIALMLPWVIS